MGETKHRTLTDALKAEILSSKYSASRAIPSETQLSRKFKVSRTTVRKALDSLHHEGWIRSVRGRGTFVTRKGASRKIGLAAKRGDRLLVANEQILETEGSATFVVCA